MSKSNHHNLEINGQAHTLAVEPRVTFSMRCVIISN